MNNRKIKHSSRKYYFLRFSFLLAAFVFLQGIGYSSADMVIIEDSFSTEEGWLERVTNTVPDVVNLPGYTWVLTAQYGWADPFIPAWDY